VKKPWRYLLLIGILCLLTYVRGLPSPFVAEDFSLIAFSSLDFGKIWELSLTATRVRPLLLYLGWLLYQMFGVVPVGHRLFVLILHVLNTMLVFFFGKSLGKDERVGLVASLLFSIYPRHHQSVLWLAASQYVIAATFMLAGLLCFDAYLRRRTAWLQVMCFLSLCLAVAGNEVGIVMIPLLFLIEVVSWQFRQRGWRNLLHARVYLKYLPYLVFLIVYVVATFGQGRLSKLGLASETPEAAEGWKYDTYHLTVGPSTVKDLVVYLIYLVYPQIPLRSLDIGLVTGLLSVLTLSFLFFLLVKGKSAVRFALLWMSLTLMPYVLFVPFGNADRYFYISAIGVSLLGGLLGCWVYDRLRARFTSTAQVVAIFAVGVYLISSAMIVQQRIDEWRHAGEIAADVIEQTKRLYPSIPAGSTMLFVGLPDQYKQAYVFLGGGIGGAMDLAYRGQPSSPMAYQTRDPLVVSFLKEARVVDRPVRGLYVFLYEDGVLFDKTDAVDSLEPLQRGTWFR